MKRYIWIACVALPLSLLAARYPEYPSRQRQLLNGTWSFAWLGEKVAVERVVPADVKCSDLMTVPGVYDTSLSNYGRRGAGLYRRCFTTGTGRYRLCLEGLGLYGKVWVDGVALGEVKLPWSTVTFDFEATAGEHCLEILVDNRYNQQTAPLFRRDYDFYPYGGIYRDVWLLPLPAQRVETVVVKTLAVAPAEVEVSVQLAGARDGDSVEVVFTSEPKRLQALTVKDNYARGRFILSNAAAWYPTNPVLQQVTVRYAKDALVERFGLRTIQTKGRELLLNGEPLRLYGVNRHESHPQLGPVQTPHLMLEDIKLVQALGGNFIRTVHYQHDSAFYELCDETGMLVWAESIGWGLGGYNDPKNRTLLNIQPFLEASTRIVGQMVANHPSVILAGFLNECASDNPLNIPVYESLASILRSTAPNALVTYASNRIQKDKCMHVCDVVSVNYYPGWIWPESQGTPEGGLAHFIQGVAKWASDEKNLSVCNKPLITAETGCCGVLGVRDLAAAQWSEDYQSRYLDESVKASMGTGRFVGVCIWQMFDTRSYVNMCNIRGKFRGFNNAGLLDEYRRPKLAFYTIRDRFKALRQAENQSKTQESK